MILKPETRVLVMAAVPAERDALLRGLRENTRFDILLAGVGPVSSAVNTTKALAAGGYGLVISVGIAGGFPGKAEVGSLVVADEIVAAELGAETLQGFQSLDELGLGSASIRVDAGLVRLVSSALQKTNLPFCIGPVLTVSTVTGTTAGAAERASRVPGAAAEAMEGYGVALAAYNFGVPMVEIRAVSNLVGPRDREAWRLKEALDLLETAGTALLEVLR